MRLLSFMSKTSIQSPNPSLIIAFQNIWMENSNIFPKYLDYQIGLGFIFTTLYQVKWSLSNAKSPSTETTKICFRIDLLQRIGRIKI